MFLWKGRAPTCSWSCFCVFRNAWSLSHPHPLPGPLHNRLGTMWWKEVGCLFGLAVSSSFLLIGQRHMKTLDSQTPQSHRYPILTGTKEQRQIKLDSWHLTQEHTWLIGTLTQWRPWLNDTLGSLIPPIQWHPENDTPDSMTYTNQGYPWLDDIPTVRYHSGGSMKLIARILHLAQIVYL